MPDLRWAPPRSSKAPHAMSAPAVVQRYPRAPQAALRNPQASADRSRERSSSLKATPTGLDTPPVSPVSTTTPSRLQVKEKQHNRRLPPVAVAYLKAWYLQQPAVPYPSEAEKDDLAEATGLEKKQINDWLINARRRIKHPVPRPVVRQRSNSAAPATPSQQTSRPSAPRTKSSSTFFSPTFVPSIRAAEVDVERAESSWSRSSSIYSLPPNPHDFERDETPLSRSSSIYQSSGDVERVESRSRSSSIYSLAPSYFPSTQDEPDLRSRSSSIYSFPPSAVQSQYGDDDYEEEVEAIPPPSQDLAARRPSASHPYYSSYFHKAYAIEPTYAYAQRAEYATPPARNEYDLAGPTTSGSTYRVRYPRPPEVDSSEHPRRGG